MGMEMGTATPTATGLATATCCHRTSKRAGGPSDWSTGSTNTWRPRRSASSWMRTAPVWRRSSSGLWNRPPPEKVSTHSFILLAAAAQHSIPATRWIEITTRRGTNYVRLWEVKCYWRNCTYLLPNVKLLGNGFVSTKRHGRAKNKINDTSAFGQFLIWHHRQEEKHLGKQFLDKKVNLNP